MRVHIYKGSGDGVALLFEPARGKHKIPVLVQGVSREDVKEVTARNVAKMRGSPLPGPG